MISGSASAAHPECGERQSEGRKARSTYKNIVDTSWNKGYIQDIPGYWIYALLHSTFTFTSTCTFTSTRHVSASSNRPYRDISSTSLSCPHLLATRTIQAGWRDKYPLLLRTRVLLRVHRGASRPCIVRHGQGDCPDRSMSNYALSPETPGTRPHTP